MEIGGLELFFLGAPEILLDADVLRKLGEALERGSRVLVFNSKSRKSTTYKQLYRICKLLALLEF